MDGERFSNMVMGQWVPPPMPCMDDLRRLAMTDPLVNQALQAIRHDGLTLEQALILIAVEQTKALHAARAQITDLYMKMPGPMIVVK